ncbi:MAG: hypothetical protein ABI867_10135 [Kofleriaceae bacterium]
MSQYNPYSNQNPYTPSLSPLARRSAIPKVIGILMIIFGSIGVVGVLIGQVMPQDPHLTANEGWRDFQKISTVMAVIGLPLALLQLFAGLMLVKYKSSGPKLALAYVILAFINTVANIVVTIKVLQPVMSAMEGPGGGVMKSAVGFGVVIGAIFGISWLIVIFALTQRKSAKDACVN